MLVAGEPAAEAPVPDGGRVVLAPRGHEPIAGVEVDVESTGGAREALVTRVGHIEKPDHRVFIESCYRRIQSLLFLLEVQDLHLNVLGYGCAGVCPRHRSLGPEPYIDMEVAAGAVQGDADNVSPHVQHILRLRDGGYIGQVRGTQTVKPELEIHIRQIIAFGSVRSSGSQSVCPSGTKCSWALNLLIFHLREVWVILRSVSGQSQVNLRS